jgi:hypothetical protein
MTRHSSAALGSTWNSETGLAGDTGCPEEARLDVHHHRSATTGAYEPSTRRIGGNSLRGLVGPPRWSLVLTAGVEQGRHLDCRERHTTTHLRMRCCRLSGRTVDNAMNHLL